MSAGVTPAQAAVELMKAWPIPSNQPPIQIEHGVDDQRTGRGMTAPPGTARTQTTGEMSAEAASQTQRRIDAAVRLALAWNIGWSRSKVLRLIRRYEYEVKPNGHTLFSFLVNAAKLTEDQRREAHLVALNDPDNFILFRDPVGEKAVRNVFRERGF